MSFMHGRREYVVFEDLWYCVLLRGEGEEAVMQKRETEISSLSWMTWANEYKTRMVVGMLS